MLALLIESLVSAVPPTYTAHQDTIGPQSEQRNASVPGGSLFNCPASSTPSVCITFAENLCTARDWCNSLAILGLYPSETRTAVLTKAHHIQLYHAGIDAALPGHHQWTLFTNDATPPRPPGPHPPNEPSIAYCSTKRLAEEMANALFSSVVPNDEHSAIARASRDVFDALQLGVQCNATARLSNRRHGVAERRVIASRVDAHYRTQLEARAERMTQSTSKKVVPRTLVVDCEKGDDANDGLSTTKPMRTLHAALHVLATSSSSTTPAVIRVRNGTCYLASPLLLNHTSVSSAGLTITSYPRERATLSGGRLLAGLTWAEPPSSLHAPAGVQMAKLPAGVQLGNFSSVFVENAHEWRRAVRSRHPDGNPEKNGLWTPHAPGVRVGYYPSTVSKSLGSFKQSCDTIPSSTLCNKTVPHFTYGTFTGGDDRSAGYAPAFEPYWCGKWTGCRGVDYTQAAALPATDPAGPLPELPTVPSDAERIVVHSTRGTSDIWANFQWAVGKHDPKAKSLAFTKGGFQFPRGTSGMGWWFVDNAGINALSMPHEWWYSPTTSTLFMMKNGTSDTLPTSLVVGNLATLIRATGSQAQPLPPITIENLTIAHSEVTYLEPYETPSGGGYSVARRGAIEIEGAQSPLIHNCVLEDIGGNGILLSNWNRDAVIAENEIVRVGDSGVVLLGTSHYCNATGGNQPRNTLVHRNLIHEIGLFGKQGTGLFQALAMGTTVTSNAIFNGPRSGILFNDGMGGAHRVESNLMFNLCRETTDHGPFNSWDRTPYVEESNGVAAGIGPALTNITRNMFICNYECTWPIDHDDGSNTYNDTYNVVFYGGAKNFLGHDKHSIANIYFDGTYVHTPTSLASATPHSMCIYILFFPPSCS